MELESIATPLAANYSNFESNARGSDTAEITNLLVEESRSRPSSGDRVIEEEAPKVDVNPEPPSEVPRVDVEPEPQSEEVDPPQLRPEIHRDAAEPEAQRSESQDTTVFVFENPLEVDYSDEEKDESIQINEVSVLQEMD